RSPLVVTLSDGSVRNAYTVKLLNKSATPPASVLPAEGADGPRPIAGGETSQPVAVAADSSEQVRVTLTMAQPQNADVRFVAKDVSGNEVLSALDRFVVQGEMPWGRTTSRSKRRPESEGMLLGPTRNVATKRSCFPVIARSPCDEAIH